MVADEPLRVAPTVRNYRVRRVGWLALGAGLLLGFALLGAISQTGLIFCATCNGNACGPGSEVCPDSLLGVPVFLAAMAIGAIVVSIGLSLSPRPPGSKGSPTGHPGASLPHRVEELFAPFLMFFGWGVLAWGLLLPLDVFGQCHEPCVAPYTLRGIPWALAITGVVAIAAGTVVYAALVARVRRNRRDNPN